MLRIEHIACALNLNDSGDQPVPLGRQGSSSEDSPLTPLDALTLMIKLPMATLHRSLAGKRFHLPQQRGLVAFDLNDEMVARASCDLESFF